MNDAVRWQKKFNELCYNVFFRNKEGNELLKMMENKFFRSPVAIPEKDPSWAYFNEGRNELIRSFSMGIQSHLNESNKEQKHDR